MWLLSCLCEEESEITFGGWKSEHMMSNDLAPASKDGRNRAPSIPRPSAMSKTVRRGPSVATAIFF